MSTKTDLDAVVVSFQMLDELLRDLPISSRRDKALDALQDSFLHAVLAARGVNNPITFK